MKKYIIISLTLLLCGVVQAQEKSNYFYVNAGGGLHNIEYKLTNGTTENNIGFTGNLGWNHFFNSHWGLGIGIGVQTFKSTATLNYMTSNAAIDTDGDAYNYRIYYADWQEKQNMISFDIPIGLSYQTKFNEKSGMMFTLGAKVSVPVKANYKQTGGEINTKGFYPLWNAELSDMPQHDFYPLKSIPADKFVAKTSYSIFADVGYLHNLSKNLDLYLGIYGNYGLNNLINSSTNFVYQQGGTYNGVMSSNQIDKANLFSAGIKIGINLHFPSKKKTIPENNNVVEEPIIEEVVPIVKVEEPVIVKVEEPVIVKAVPVTVVETPKEIVKEEKVQPQNNIKEISNDLNYHFKFNSKIPIYVDVEKTKELAELLKQNPDITLHIVGHTCNEGSKKVNVKIGRQRAEVIKRLYVKHGVPMNQLTTQTKYYLEPDAPNTNIDNRMKNRRVKLFVE